MYKDAITLFNHYEDETSDLWYAHTLTGVDLNADRANIVKEYGEDSGDNATLHIKLGIGKTIICGCGCIKPYVLPKAWEQLDSTARAECVTLHSGMNADFFIVGEWDGMTVIDGSTYPQGLYQHVNATYDQCYAVTGVSEFSVIPHLEVTAR